MAVTVTENGRLFTIHTANSTYQMKADKYGVLLHLYYGRRTEGSMEYLLTYADRGFASNIYDCGCLRTRTEDLPPIYMTAAETALILWTFFRRNSLYREQAI